MKKAPINRTSKAINNQNIRVQREEMTCSVDRERGVFSCSTRCTVKSKGRRKVREIVRIEKRLEYREKKHCVS